MVVRVSLVVRRDLSAVMEQTQQEGPGRVPVLASVLLVGVQLCTVRTGRSCLGSAEGGIES